MALKKEELFSTASRGARARITPDARGLYVATFAADALIELLIAGCPVAYNESSGLWVPYTQSADNAQATITSNATPATGGSWDIVINGMVVQRSFDVTAAALQVAIRAALAEEEPLASGITCTATAEANLGVANAIITVDFPEEMGAVDIQGDFEDLTGNVHVLAVVDAGTALNGADKIKAFVFEDPIQIDASDDVLGVIMVKGEAESADVNTAAVRALLRGSPSSAELLVALGQPSLRDAGIFVRGLSTVH